MSLKLEHITKSFGMGSTKTNVLKDINLEVKPGEFVILNGASGSGKSTLLNILGGLLTPTSGDILYNGHHLYSKYKNRSDLRLKDIGFIFQASHLVPYLTVEEQLTIVAKEAGIKESEANSTARSLLTEIGLKERLNAYPHMLSGGEQQRVAIMRSFINQPKIILADEPTASLDAERATKVVEMIKNRIKSNHMIGMMITHDQRLFNYADRVIQLDDGKILG